MASIACALPGSPERRVGRGRNYNQIIILRNLGDGDVTFDAPILSTINSGDMARRVCFPGRSASLGFIIAAVSTRGVESRRRLGHGASSGSSPLKCLLRTIAAAARW